MKKRKKMFLIFLLGILGIGLWANNAPILDNSYTFAIPNIQENQSVIEGIAIADFIPDGAITDPDGIAEKSIAMIGVDNTNGIWEFSTDNGTTWIPFTGVLGEFVDFETSARLLDGSLLAVETHKVRFVPNPDYPNELAWGEPGDPINGTTYAIFRAWDKSAGTAGETADASINGNATAFSQNSANLTGAIISVNDEPVFYHNNLVINDEHTVPDSIDEDTTYHFLNYGFTVDDIDLGNNHLVFGISSSHGSVFFPNAYSRFINGNGTANVTIVNTADIINDLLTDFIYTPNAYYNGVETITVRLNDQGHTGTGGGDDVIRTVFIHIRPVNNAPILNTLFPFRLTTINEGEFDNTGTSVNAIIPDGAIADYDGVPVKAIAVISVDNTNGKWQYSLDNGNIFLDFTDETGNVSIENQARLLDGTLSDGETNVIRFLPDEHFNGQATFKFRAWDKDTGETGLTEDASLFGGNTPFSTEVGTSYITVRSTNDQPELYFHGLLVQDTLQAYLPISDPFVYNFTNDDSVYVVDPDIGEEILSVNINTSQGIVTIQNPGVGVYNNGSRNVTLVGRITAVNNWLSDFVYEADFGCVGCEVMLFGMDDYGYSGDKIFVERAITFQLTNNLPIFSSVPDTTVLQDEQYVYNITCIDVEDNPITLEAEIVPEWLTFVNNGNGIGSLTGTPLNQHVGFHNVSLKAYDWYSEETPVYQNFTIEVINVNDAPYVANPLVDFSIDEDSVDTSINLKTVFDDIDIPYGDVLTFSVTGNVNIAVDIDQITGIVTLTPIPDWSGSETLVFTATDLDGAFVTDDVIITVLNVNDGPFVVNPLIDFSMEEDTVDTSISLTTVFDDLDLIYGDVLTFSVTGNNNIGVQINQTTGIVTITPALNWVGVETLEFTATDVGNETASDDVTITVTNVNDAPHVANPLIDFEMDEDTVDTSINLSIVFDDVDIPYGDELSYSFAGNVNLAVEINQTTGIVTLTPPANWIGSETLVFTATDLLGETATDDVIVTVVDVNDGPHIVLPLPDVFKDEDFLSFSIDLDNYFADIDGDVLVYSADFNSNEIGTSIAGSILSVDSVLNWNGTTTITITADDQRNRLTISDSFDVIISPVNDAPEFISEPILVANQNIQYIYNIQTTDVDGDALIIDSTLLPSWLSLTDNGDGTALLSGTPLLEHVGLHDVVLTVTDGIIMTPVEQIFTITVRELNLPPYFVSVPVLSVLQDAVYSYNVETEDPNTWAELTMNAVEIPDWLSFLDNGDGTALLSGAPLNEHVGNHNVVLSVDDGLIDSPVLQEFIIEVINVNDAPYVANPLVDFSMNEDTVDTSINLSNVFDDVDLAYGDELSYSYAGNVNITVEINQTTGIVTLTPAMNWFGTETIEFTATDLLSETAMDDVIITVIDVNDEPIITLPDSFTFAEDTSLQVDFTAYINDLEQAHNEMILTATGNTNVNVSIEGMLVTFTALQDWSGTETLTFTVNDQQGRAIASDNTDMIVTPVNDAPYVANPLVDFSINEDTVDTSINLSNVFDDVDLAYGDELSYSYAGNVNITVEINQTTGVVTLTPTLNWFGAETIEFTATDLLSETAMDDVIITVSDTNDEPAITLPDSFTFAEDTSLQVDFTAYITDLEQAHAEMTLTVAGNTNIYATIEGMLVTFTAMQDWSGTETLTFTVNDQQGRAVASDETDVIVTQVNDAPYVANPLVDFSMNEDTVDTSINLSNVFDDVDLAYGDELTYSFANNVNINVEINQTTGIVTLTPAMNWFGTETIEFTATDLLGENVMDDVIITVTDVNDEPIITLPDSFTFAEDTSLHIDFTAYITDIEQLHTEMVLTAAGNTNVNVSIESMLVTFTAMQDWSGTETLTFTINDQQGRALASDETDIIVTPVNDTPYVVNPLVDFSMNEDTVDTSINLSAVFADVDLAYGDELTYSFANNVNITVDINQTTGVVTLTPAMNWFGMETIEFTATDLLGENVMDDVIITVTDVNDAPEITLPDSFTFAEDTSLQVDFTAYITDIEQLHTEMVLTAAGNTNVNATIEGMLVTFTAMQDWSGTETLTFTVNDQQGRAIASDNTDIIVTPVNDAPFVANPLVDFSMNEDTVDTSINLSNVFDDVDLAYGDELSYSYTGNVNITVEINQTTGVVTLTPTLNWFGAETIEFTATDLLGENVMDDVIITVIDVNDEPIITLPDSFTFSEDTSLQVDFTAYINDLEQAHAEMTLTIAGNSNVSVAINGMLVTFTALQDWSGTETLTFTVNDQQGRAVASDEADVIVTQVNDAPYVANPLVDFSMNEDTVDTSINLSAVFADVDLAYGDELTYSFANNVNFTVEINQTTGVVTLTPAMNWFGTETIEFTATDLLSETAMDDVIITVIDVNDEPTITLPDSFTFAEDTSLQVDFTSYINDLEQAHAEMTLTAAGNTNVNATIEGMLVTFTAMQDWSGMETLTFTVNDQQGRAVASDETDVVVTPVNDAPYVANPLVDFSMNEDTVDTSINLSNVFDDVDLAYGDELAYSFANNVNINVEINQTTGVVTLTPAMNWFGTETIEFTATDLLGENVMDDVIITVIDVNDAPEITLPDSFTFAEDTSLQVDFTAYINDLEQAHTEMVLTAAGNTNIYATIEGMLVTFTTMQDWSGTETLTFTINDQQGRAIASDETDVVVTLVNDAPYVANPLVDFSMNEDTVDTSINLSNVFADVDLAYGDELTYSFANNVNINVEINQTTGVVTLTPAMNWFGTETIEFTATDLLGENVMDDVIVTVINLNGAPYLEDSLPQLYLFENFSEVVLDLNLYFSDPDNDVITYSIVYNENEIDAVINESNLVLNSILYWNGASTISITASDPDGLNISEDLTIIVQPLNSAPILTQELPNTYVYEDFTTPIELDLNNHFEDPDGDILTFEAIYNNEEISVEISEAEMTITSVLNWNGNATLIVTAFDPQGLNVGDEMTISVEAVNDAPEFTSTPITTAYQGQEYSYFVTAEDVDGDLLTLTATQSAPWLTFTDNGDGTGLLTGMPEFEDVGSYNIQLTVSDGIIPSPIEQDFVLTVESTNTAPEFTSIPITQINQDEEYVYNVTTFDLDGDIVVIEADFSAEWLNFTDNGDGTGTLSGTPANELVGVYSVSLTVTDGIIENPVSQSFIIEVININDAPYVANLLIDFSMNEDTVDTSINLSTVFADVDLAYGDELTYSFANNVNISTQINQTTGVVTLIPTEDWFGVETLTFIATDSSGLSNQDDVQITVIDVYDEPIVINPEIFEFSITDISQGIVIDLTQHFYHPDGLNMSYILEFNPNEINAYLDGHELHMNPILYWFGTTYVKVIADDGAGNRTVIEKTFEITISFNLAVINANTTALDFGTVFVGEDSEIKQIAISNEGDAVLAINSINAPPEFTMKLLNDTVWQTDLSNVNVAVGQAITLQVKLTPKSQKMYQGNLVIDSNAHNQPSIQIAMTAGTQNPLPNAFTPNGDGKNDEFVIKLNSNEDVQIKLMIYNLQGRKIHEIWGNSGQPISWDGKDDDNNDCRTNPYLYVLYKDGSVHKRGKIYLIR